MNDSLKVFINRKKKLIEIYVFLIHLYTILKILTFKHNSLNVLEFAFISLIFGLTPAYFLRHVFKFKNLFSWFTNACAISIVLIPFTFLIFGWLNFNFIFTHSILFLYSVGLVSMLILLVVFNSETQEEYEHFKSIKKEDVFLYGLIVSVSILLTLHNFRRVWPRWDAFTYWALDTKYIFDFNKLRGDEFDVFDFFKKFSSFLPILFSIAYDLYDQVIEQLANWINVFIHFLAMMLIFNRAIGKSILQKLIVITLLIVVSYTADPTAFLYSMYAEVLAAFLVLLFVIVLTEAYNPSSKNYALRVLTLVLIASSLYFVKPKFSFLVYGLLLFFIIYDFKFIFKNARRIFTSYQFYIAIISVLAIWLLNRMFVDQTFGVEDSVPSVEGFLVSQRKPLSTFIEYTKVIIVWLLENSPYISGLWLLSVISILFTKHPLKQKQKNYMFIYLLVGGLFSVFVLAYINRQASLQSASLARYTSIVMYLIPFLFLFVNIHLSKKTIKYFLLAILVAVNIFVFAKLSIPWPRISNLTQLTYRDSIWDYAGLADKVLEISGDDARIIIANDYPENFNSIRNQDVPDIYVRYFLMYNSVGGQYRITMSEFVEKIASSKPDYILLLSYENSYKDCSQLLTEGHDYLIEIDYETFGKTKGCVFSDYPIIDLTEN